MRYREALARIDRGDKAGQTSAETLESPDHHQNGALKMAVETVAQQVPESLLERFTEHEAPEFKLMRECGEIRLWQSVTPMFVGDGWWRPSGVRYHITEGNDAVITHMANRYENALSNFNKVVQQYGQHVPHV